MGVGRKGFCYYVSNQPISFVFVFVFFTHALVITPEIVLAEWPGGYARLAIFHFIFVASQLFRLL